MAQTIGYQRGKVTSFTANDNSPSTAIRDMFTNTSTSPMRVILAGFESKADTQAPWMLVQIGVKQNGSASDIACVMYKYSGGTGGSQMTTMALYGGAQDNRTSNSLVPLSASATTDLVAQGSTNLMAWSGPPNSNLLWNAGGGTGGLGGGSVTQVVPAYIWLLPGDTLCFRAYSNGGGLLTVIWSCVTIADSGT